MTIPGEPFVENSAEAINYLTKYWDRGFDAINNRLHLFSNSGTYWTPETKGYARAHKRLRARAKEAPRVGKVSASGENFAPSATSRRRVQKDRLPSPEGSIESWDHRRFREQSDAGVAGAPGIRSPSLDRESLQSERVIRAYRVDPSDPVRTVESVLPNAAANSTTGRRRRDREEQDRMSYGNGNLGPPGQQGRSTSAQPARSRYYDDEEYGSDYDDRRGGRYNTTGRGYNDRDDYDDRGDYRETITTERYRGPAGNFDNRRQSFRGNDQDQGAVTQYNQQRSGGGRSTTDVGAYQGRSRSRGRRYSERDRGGNDSRSRSRSYSGSRSRSRERGSGGGGFEDHVGKYFDTSLQGIGFGLAGAVAGGMAGRHLGDRNPRHKNRDIFLGAVVGALGVNAAENQYQNWQDDKRGKVREDEQRWEGNYGGRSRSSAR